MHPPHSTFKWMLLLLCCNLAYGSKPLKTFAGPYIAYAIKLDNCPSDGGWVCNLRFSHFNPAKPLEKQLGSGSVTFKDDFDDKYQFYGSLAIRSNNEWKSNSFIFNMPGGFCSVVRDHMPGVYRFLSKNASLQQHGTVCRIPAGVTYFDKEPISWDFPKFQNMPYGRYLFTVQGRNGTSRKRHLCLQVECVAIPKQDLQ